MQSKDYDDHLQNLNDLVKRYEQAHEEDLPIYFGESDLEDVVEYYIDNQMLDKAALAADEGVDQFKYSTTFYLKKAEILIETGAYGEAWEFLDKAATLAPNEVAIMLHRADIKTHKGEYQEAIDWVEGALAVSDNDEKGDLLLELADIYEEWEKYFEVMDCLQACLEIDPSNEEALNRLWFCVELTERYEDSMTFHKKMVNAHPYNELMWYNLAHAYNGLHMSNEALEAFEFVIAIDDTYEPAFIDAADIHYQQENYSKAIEYYKEAIEKGAPKKELYYNIGKCYDKLKKTVEARTYYKKCITIDPYYAKAFHKIGVGYLSLDLPKNALSPLERAIKLDNKNTEFLKSMAFAYVKTEQLDEAIDLYYQILAFNPLEKAIHLHYISALYEKGCITDALEHLDDTIQIFNEDYTLLYIKTAFLLELGKRSEAKVTLTQALQVVPEKSSQLFEMMPELEHDLEIVQLVEQFRT